MRKALVAGNWKMHGSRAFAQSYLTALQQALPQASCDVALIPPYVYLSGMAQKAAEYGFALGAQDVATEQEGAFTGEVSADMLIDTGCKYVLVGHSERRSLYGESDEIVARKFEAALQAGLTPILCVGESLAQRESGDTVTVVKAQLDAVLRQVGSEKLASAVVAYEPIWAIGTGLTATPDQAQEVHAALRNHLGSLGQQTRILYGGSVKAASAEELFAQQDIDGGLVGGASLDAEEFAAICIKAGTTS